MQRYEFTTVFSILDVLEAIGRKDIDPVNVTIERNQDMIAVTFTDSITSNELNKLDNFISKGKWLKK